MDRRSKSVRSLQVPPRAPKNTDTQSGIRYFFVRRRDLKGRHRRSRCKKHAGGMFFSPWESPSISDCAPCGCKLKWIIITIKPHDFQGIWRSWGIFRSLCAICICLQPFLPISVALVARSSSKDKNTLTIGMKYILRYFKRWISYDA